MPRSKAPRPRHGGKFIAPAQRIAALFILLAVIAGDYPATARGEDLASAPAQKNCGRRLFDRSNLVAWCIVPFDSRRRGPAERAEMLSRLGFTRFAYDYRAEHIPTFEAEIATLAEHHIELTAWWFPGELNAEARGILDILAQHHLHPQLWVTGGGGPTTTDAQRAARIEAEVARLRPIAEAAARIGSQVGLYNHGGWFGEPENQIAVIEALKLSNVGIVYNLHHGHSHLDRFPALLTKMLPHLLAINLNGMNRDGEAGGQKILPLGQGELDLALLTAIRDSGYCGPIGILGHTDDDAAARLSDNLDGLDWLLKQMDGQPPGERPQPRTYHSPHTAQAPVPLPNAAPLPAGIVEAHSADIAQLPPTFDAAWVSSAIRLAEEQASASRGMEVFQSARFACLSCHQVGPHGGTVGPCLTDVGRRLKPAEIVEAICWPKLHVKPEFSAWRIVLSDGRSTQGYKRGGSDKTMILLDPATGKKVEVNLADIEEQKEIGTLMPEGLAAAMSPVERLDLIRFLLELGRTPGLEDTLQPGNKPVSFAYDRAPLDRAAWPHWESPVNRDRVYDFYTKEALFFRQLPVRPHLLPAGPDLDGGQYGHWGNQNENVWRDYRWSQTDLGSLLCGVFHGPRGPVPKAVCVRLGDQGEASCCFDPQTLSYPAIWRGDFLKLSAVRHGFTDGLRPAGELLKPPQANPPELPFVYHGFYRLGHRVVFAYRLGEIEMLDSPWVEAGQFVRTVAPADEHPLALARQGGAAQWPEQISTPAQLGSGQPYAIDTIQLPAENPWHALLFFGDHDFLPDGSALIATMQGDVWHVTGLDDQLTNVRWRRFASGLHQPLGLVVADGHAFVLGRDQITRLTDVNQDGEADYYECFSNRFETSPAGHDFTCGLVRDSQGRFYTASGKQGLIRISADGQQVDVLATGFRNPDGIGICPDGAITVPTSEGDWTPASSICLIKPSETTRDDATGGATLPLHFGYQGPRDGQLPALPLAYLPRLLDNSSGGQATVPNDRWGPLAGQMIHFSFGAGSHFLVLRDEVAGQPQGAVVPLAGEFTSGAHRGKFSPRDGQLYVSGMAGWGSYTPADGCFQRVRFTGAAVQLPRQFHVHENGILVRFTSPIDPARLADKTRQFAQAWNYRYSPAYGSPELAPGHPGVVGHELVEIAAVHPLDSHTLFVELPDLQPVSQLHLLLEVDDGKPQEVFCTIHRLDKPFTLIPGYRPANKTRAAHPLEIDLKLMGEKIPNPWVNRVPSSTPLALAAGTNLTFSERTLRAKAGQNLKVTFRNPDVVPHNWVLVKPGSLDRVGDRANRLIADPEAVLHQYVPQTDDVLAYTDIVPPQQEFSIYFQAPLEPGRYPYLCTFPGHWMVMNGELIVE